MTILRPPRREPKALAVDLHPKGICLAVCTPWNLGNCGVQRCRDPNRALALRRIIRRERPTALTTLNATLVPLLDEAGKSFRLPVVDAHALPLPRFDVARDLFPEVVIVAPTHRLKAVARLAIAAVLHAEPTSRNYARRNQPSLRHAGRPSDR